MPCLVSLLVVPYRWFSEWETNSTVVSEVATATEP